MMRVDSEIINGVSIIIPDVFEDDRGCFIETYRREWFPNSREMIQSNRADRAYGSVVGLHYHLHQADYWYVPFGSCRIVLHDLRVGSPTKGRTLIMDVGAPTDGPGLHNHSGVYIPPGVAHGFSALTDMTITYMVDGYYNKNDELGVAWDDPAINAQWGIQHPILSERDMNNPRIEEIPERLMPHFGLR